VIQIQKFVRRLLRGMTNVWIYHTRAAELQLESAAALYLFVRSDALVAAGIILLALARAPARRGFLILIASP
jgi:hypothetical protein